MMHDVLDNSVLMMSVDSLMDGILDKNNYIVRPPFRARITLTNYIRALYTCDCVRKSLDTFTGIEFIKETVLIGEIGNYLTRELRDALEDNDKERIKHTIALFKKETARIYELCKKKGEYTRTLSNATVKDVLDMYNTELKEESKAIDLFPSPAKVVDARSKFKKNESNTLK